MATASPVKGLSVENFWAAHAVKRAWAVKGANLSVCGGEVLLLIGEDGSGKSRLLTALVESQINIPKKAKTIIPVKGKISVGGLDVNRWDREVLKSRLGLILSDMSSATSFSKVYSGMTLEEILDPTSGEGLGAFHRNHDSRKASESIKLAVKVSFLVLHTIFISLCSHLHSSLRQIVGLADSLLPRLSAKLSTVVTAIEEDLIPNPLRPPTYILSPSEWNKVLLAKVISQLIYLNSNPIASDSTIEGSLVGNILLLDDSLQYMDEIEEAKLINRLRSTGAAVIITSNRWACGRFSDKIAVLKDGVIVDYGKHDELLGKGPMHSFYASKWQKMMSS